MKLRHAHERGPNTLGDGDRTEPHRSANPAPAFVFFDAGNTLITSRYRIDTVYAATFRRHGAALPDGEAARQVLGPIISAVWGSIQDALKPGQNRYGLADGSDRVFWRRFVDQIADRADLELDRQAAFEELYAYYSLAEAWDVYEDVRPALDILHAAGVRMGIISNWDARLPRLLETLGLSEYVDPIVVSAIEGIEKPSPRLFLHAAERAGVPPERCLHIGDSEPLDVLGARAAGMHPLLILRGRAGKLASALDTPRERSTDAEVVRDLRTLAERILPRA